MRSWFRSAPCRQLRSSICLLLFSAFPANGEPGHFDNYFNCYTEFYEPDTNCSCSAVALQLDGARFLLAGSTRTSTPPQTPRDFALARFYKDGSLDESFGTNGKTTTDFGGIEEVLALAVRKYDPFLPELVVAAGTKGSGASHDFALASYDPVSGSLVASFGVDGKVVTDFEGGDDVATGVAIQPDGKIVAAGRSGNSHIAVARYLANGSLDADFGDDGTVKTYMPGTNGSGWVSCLALQTDGKIVVAGYGGDKIGGGTNSIMIVARYHGSETTGIPGTLDESFGDLGFRTIPFDEGATVMGMTIQSDGKILLAGSGTNNAVVARLAPSGSLDKTFGGDGKVSVEVNIRINPFVSFPIGVAVQADQKVVITGELETSLSPFLMFAARLNVDGSLDPNFGISGVGRASDATSTALLLDRDGKIYVAGNGPRYNFRSRFALTRFLTAQSDLQVAIGAKRTVGNDFYSTNSTGQNLPIVFRGVGVTRRVSVRLQNDGPVSDTFAFRGHRSNGNLDVSYFSKRSNVSAAVIAGNFLTGAMGAGRSIPIKVLITSKTRKPTTSMYVRMFSHSLKNSRSLDVASIRAIYR